MSMRPAALLAFLLPACVLPAGKDDVVDEVFEVTLSDTVATVATVSWSTDEPVRVQVEFGLTDAYGSTTPLTALSSEHTVPLLGLPPDTLVHFRLLTDEGDGPEPGADHTFTTGSLPSGLPAVDVSGGPRDTVSDAFTIFPWYAPGGDGGWIYVVDRGGAVVWYAEMEGQCLTAMFSADGRAVLALLSDEADESDSRIVRLPLDGGEASFVPAPFAHHTFVELPGDEGYAYVASVLGEADGQELKGDRIVEVSLDGTERQAWSAFGTVPVVEHDGFAFDPPDWTHANGIDYDAARGRYLLSLYRQEQIYAIDRATGAVDWVLGEGGDFAFVDDVGFGTQHGPVVTAGGVLLFDNGSATGEVRLVEYALDEEAGTAVRAWSQAAPDDEQTRIMGSVRRVPDGSVSSWGEVGHVVTMSDTGDVTRRIAVMEIGVVGTVSTRQSLYPE